MREQNLSRMMKLIHDMNHTSNTLYSQETIVHEPTDTITIAKSCNKETQENKAKAIITPQLVLVSVVKR